MLLLICLEKSFKQITKFRIKICMKSQKKVKLKINKTTRICLRCQNNVNNKKNKVLIEIYQGKKEK